MAIFFGVWLSLVERLVRDQEVAGSNPATPTIKIRPEIVEISGLILPESLLCAMLKSA